jgi:aminoglycoside 6'-N-acetyltransferase
MKSEIIFDSYPFICENNITLSKIQQSDQDGLIALINENKDSVSDCFGISTPSEDPLDFFYNALTSVDGSFYSHQRIILGLYDNLKPNNIEGVISISDFDYDTDSIKINFISHTDDKSKNLLALGIKTLCSYLFKSIHTQRIYSIIVSTDNTARNILENSLFSLDGVIRNCMRTEAGIIVSTAVYSIFSSEFSLIKNGGLFLRSGSISISNLKEDSFPLMAKWLSDERVLEYYDGRDNPSDIEKIKTKYGAKIKDDTVTPCIINKDETPIGYIQFYKIPTEDLSKYSIEKSSNPYSIDIFIGEPDEWSHGIGTKSICMVSQYIFDSLNADVLISAPELWNKRSINAFINSGFSQIGILPDCEMHEGKLESCLILQRNREK